MQVKLARLKSIAVKSRGINSALATRWNASLMFDAIKWSLTAA